MNYRWFYSLWLIWPLVIFANEDFIQQHTQGWHWYRQAPVAEKTQPPFPMLPSANVNPVQGMKHVRAALEYALDQAILQPTADHVHTYLHLQNAISERASRFATLWQHVLLQHPDLDYALVHPMNQLARTAQQAEEALQAERNVQQLVDRYHLVFVFKAGCPYCQQFAPLVKTFAAHFGFTVLAITIDGKSLPDFPEARLVNASMLPLSVPVVPALFALNKRTLQLVPISYGTVSETALLEHMAALTKPVRE